MSTPPNLSQDIQLKVIFIIHLPIDDVCLTHHLIKPVLNGSIGAPPLLWSSVTDAVHSNLMTWANTFQPINFNHSVYLDSTIFAPWHSLYTDEIHRMFHGWDNHWDSCKFQGTVCLGKDPSFHH